MTKPKTPKEIQRAYDDAIDLAIDREQEKDFEPAGIYYNPHHSSFTEH